MLVKAEMVALPVTAHTKFREAIYFFNQMLEAKRNVRTFPCLLSAFLSAMRSVTFFLQAQFGESEQFATWYKGKQEAMRDDPLLRMLKDLRDEELHARPLALKFWHGPTLPGDGIYTDHLEVEATTDEAGEVRTWLIVGRDGVREEVPAMVKWVIDRPDETDILVACDSGLRKLKDLLEEWDAMRGPVA